MEKVEKLSLFKHIIVKACRGMKAKFLSFLNSPLVKDDWPTSQSGLIIS
jgi:hypothetical protein